MTTLKNIDQVITQFGFNPFQPAKCGNMSLSTNRVQGWDAMYYDVAVLYSYAQPIAACVKGLGFVVLNSPKRCSQTTRKHINKVKRECPNIQQTDALDTLESASDFKLLISGMLAAYI